MDRAEGVHSCLKPREQKAPALKLHARLKGGFQFGEMLPRTLSGSITREAACGIVSKTHVKRSDALRYLCRAERIPIWSSFRGDTECSKLVKV